MKQIKWFFAFAAIILAIGTVTASNLKTTNKTEMKWYPTDETGEVILSTFFIGDEEEAKGHFGCNGGLKYCAVAVNSSNEPIPETYLRKP